MSVKVAKITPKAAVAFNSKNQFKLPPYVLAAFPELQHPVDSADFALGLMEVQEKHLGMRREQVDGCLGIGTFTALLKKINPIDSEYVVYNSERLALPISEKYALISFDEPKGLDLHPRGKFGRRKGGISGITLHWGGLNAEHCYNVFASDSRDVSSHFVIGRHPEDGVRVYQLLDLRHCAWHGGKVNDFTIGIDICQSPEINWFDHYSKDKNYSIQKIKNTSGRGPATVLSLDPVLAEGAAAFIQDLMHALNFELRTPPDHRTYSIEELQQFTLFGHHHASEKKYDVACWWDLLVRRGNV